MAEYHVGCGLFGIYAGTLKKNGREWKNKTECTGEALCSVRDYLYSEAIRENRTTFGYEWAIENGEVIELLIKIRESDQSEGE